MKRPRADIPRLVARSSGTEEPDLGEGPDLSTSTCVIAHASTPMHPLRAACVDPLSACTYIDTYAPVLGDQHSYSPQTLIRMVAPRLRLMAASVLYPHRSHVPCRGECYGRGSGHPASPTLTSAVPGRQGAGTPPLPPSQNAPERASLDSYTGGCACWHASHPPASGPIWPRSAPDPHRVCLWASHATTSASIESDAHPSLDHCYP